jgi:ABC-type phosphate/phosphonate transport system substrate-binding protein
MMPAPTTPPDGACLPIANARMYSVSPEAGLAWRRLFDWLAAASGVALDIIDHAYPAKLPDLWARPDLAAVFVCGWPYAARLNDLQIVAAPVPRTARSAGRALYWTDMVVRADGRFHTLEDTFGGRIAYTGKDSHSGFNAVRRLLMRHAGSRPQPLYESAVGPLVTPRRSLESVVKGEADVAPVDSYAHLLLQRHCPELTEGVRTVAVSDLAPIPLLAASPTTDPALLARMRAALIGAGQDAMARPLLDDLVLIGFAEVQPRDYQITQSWARDAEQAGWHGLAPRERVPAAA